jgi:hypothetical protein
MSDTRPIQAVLLFACLFATCLEAAEAQVRAGIISVSGEWYRSNNERVTERSQVRQGEVLRCDGDQGTLLLIYEGYPAPPIKCVSKIVVPGPPLTPTKGSVLWSMVKRFFDSPDPVPRGFNGKGRGSSRYLSRATELAIEVSGGTIQLTPTLENLPMAQCFVTLTLLEGDRESSLKAEIDRGADGSATIRADNLRPGLAFLTVKDSNGIVMISENPVLLVPPSFLLEARERLGEIVQIVETWPDHAGSTTRKAMLNFCLLALNSEMQRRTR